MKDIRIPLLIVLISCLIQQQAAFSQSSPALALMPSIPQSCSINPAFDIPYYGWIGIPGISGLFAGFENSAFTFQDAVYRSPDDSLHLDIDGLIGHLSEKNYYYQFMSAELLALGFHKNEYYFEGRFIERHFLSASYSKDMISLLLNLNGDFIDKEVDLGYTGVDLTVANEINFGVSHNIRSQWRAGIRFKYLSGVANIYSKKTNVSLLTDKSEGYALTFNTDVEVCMNIPGMKIISVDSLDFEYDGTKTYHQFLAWQNPGCAFDIGLTFQLLPNLMLGASVQDLGFIRWKSDPVILVSDPEANTYTFHGIEIDDVNDPDFPTPGEYIDHLADSLIQNLKVKALYKDYTSMLVTGVNLTARYTIAGKNHLGFLLRNEFYNQHIKPKLLLNYNYDAGKGLILMAGYSLTTHSYGNLALGFSLNIGSIQFYMVSDHVLGNIMLTRTKAASLQLGFNLCFKNRRTPSFQNNDQ